MRISDWSSDVCSSDLILLFKRLWAEIAETRVQPFSIVIDFDVIKHLFLGGGSGDKTFAVYRLDLEAVIPALHGGIIVAVAALAHAAHQAIGCPQLLVFL